MHVGKTYAWYEGEEFKVLKIVGGMVTYQYIVSSMNPVGSVYTTSIDHFINVKQIKLTKLEKALQ